MGVSLSDTRRDNANETNQSATFMFYLSALVQRRCVAPGSAGWNVQNITTTLRFPLSLKFLTKRLKIFSLLTRDIKTQESTFVGGHYRMKPNHPFDLPLQLFESFRVPALCSAHRKSKTESLRTKKTEEKSNSEALKHGKISQTRCGGHSSVDEFVISILCAKAEASYLLRNCFNFQSTHQEPSSQWSWLQNGCYIIFRGEISSLWQRSAGLGSINEGDCTET